MKWETEGSWTVIASAGGFANYLFAWIKLPPGAPFGWGRMFACGMASGFTGLMAGQFVTLLGYPQWGLFVGGLGGFMGAKTMDLIFDLTTRAAPKP